MHCSYFILKISVNFNLVSYALSNFAKEHFFMKDLKSISVNGFAELKAQKSDRFNSMLKVVSCSTDGLIYSGIPS